MKSYKYILITLFIFSSVSLSAQNKFKIGVNAGLNYPDVRGNEYAKYHNFKVGYLFGVTLDYYINESLSIKGSLNYESKVRELRIVYYTYDFQESDKEYYDLVHGYIHFPLLVKYEFANAKLFVNGGPFFNYLVSDTVKPEYPSSLGSPSNAEKVDLGLSLGFGTNIKLNDKNTIIVELRDDLGLIDTANDYYGALKTNTLKLVLAWNFGV